jgi:hypothetical protein
MQDRIDAGEYVRLCDGETLSGDAALVQWDDDGLLVERRIGLCEHISF